MARNSGTVPGPIDWEYARMLLAYSKYIGDFATGMTLEYFEEQYWEQVRGRGNEKV